MGNLHTRNKPKPITLTQQQIPFTILRPLTVRPTSRKHLTPPHRRIASESGFLFMDAVDHIELVTLSLQSLYKPAMLMLDRKMCRPQQSNLSQIRAVVQDL